MDGMPFDRSLAADAGVTKDRLLGFLREGLVRQVLRGVYLDARVPDDLESRGRCLALRLPVGAAVCRLTAAWLRGVDGRMPEQCQGPPVVECVVPLGHEPVARPGVRGYVAPLRSDEVMVIGGVPCTSDLRTAVDLLRVLRPHMGLAVVDALAARGLVNAAEVQAEVDRWPGHRGVVQARYLASLIDARTESFGESWLRLRIVDAGFPRPVMQIEIADSQGRVRFRLDLGWPDRRIAVEYDGEEFHTTPERRRYDEVRRDVLLAEFGWTVIGVGKGEVLGSSMRLERGVGELLSMEPKIRRRRW